MRPVRLRCRGLRDRRCCLTSSILLARSIVQSLTGKYRGQFVFGKAVTESEKQSPRVLEGLVAQFVGAVAHLGGLAVAINELLADALPSDVEVPLEKDPKTLIQELFQTRKWPLPTYMIVGVTGPENRQTFEARVQDRSGNSGSGHGPTKRTAELNAATPVPGAASSSGRSRREYQVAPAS